MANVQKQGHLKKIYSLRLTLSPKIINSSVYDSWNTEQYTDFSSELHFCKIRWNTQVINYVNASHLKSQEIGYRCYENIMFMIDKNKYCIFSTFVA